MATSAGGLGLVTIRRTCYELFEVGPCRCGFKSNLEWFLAVTNDHYRLKYTVRVYEFQNRCIFG